MEFGDELANAYVLNGHMSAQADAQNKCWLMEQREDDASAPNGHRSMRIDASTLELFGTFFLDMIFKDA